jgi:hypothetical protein
MMIKGAEDSTDNTIGMIPVLAQRIKKDIDAARQLI